ncbi:plasmid fertility inhibition factor family protein [Pectinatus brassicae]|uniref:Uncharacterized protein n=1 Tax=Pectinatus brassicae TaxID=862415 RepID=A0A840US78_9FIRM|nr:hypothetical protein [Pectinatus brassicae]MBB5335694.1 hypothetical protein [Pectinatus brassicae]
MKILYQIKTIHYSKGILFPIPIINDEIFMCASPNNEETFIVEVNPHLFLKLWRKTSCTIQAPIAKGNESSWKKDYKYKYAQQGFAAGVTNPVPLASVNILETNDHQIELSLGDGVTRTIYLLSIKAPYFPVSCTSLKSAMLLQKVAGFSEGTVYTLSELLSDKTN